MSVCPDSLPMGSFGAPSTGAWFSCLDYVLIRRSSRNPFLVPPSSGLEDPRGPRHCLWSQHADRTIPRTPLSPSGPSWVTPHHLGGPQGGEPQCRGSAPPPPSSLRGSSGPLFVTSVRHRNRHHFRGHFWEHSASSPERPRCSGASKLQGQLNVGPFAPGPFRGRSWNTFGVPTGPSWSPFGAHGGDQILMPKPAATRGGRPLAYCFPLGPWGLGPMYMYTWEQFLARSGPPRCSRASKYVGQLDVAHFTPRKLPGHSQHHFGSPGEHLREPVEAQF